MNKKYKCIKEMHLTKFDDEEFETDDIFVVDINTIWGIPTNETYRLVGGEVRLENDDLGWIEITTDNLEECFEEVQNG